MCEGHCVVGRKICLWGKFQRVFPLRVCLCVFVFVCVSKYTREHIIVIRLIGLV